MVLALKEGGHDPCQLVVRILIQELLPLHLATPRKLFLVSAPQSYLSLVTLLLVEHHEELSLSALLFPAEKQGQVARESNSECIYDPAYGIQYHKGGHPVKDLLVDVLLVFL